MLPQDMKRCSVCTLRKSDTHFVRKEKIWKSCNECSEYCKGRRNALRKKRVKTKSNVELVVEAVVKPTRIVSNSIKYVDK